MGLSEKMEWVYGLFPRGCTKSSISKSGTQVSYQTTITEDLIEISGRGAIFDLSCISYALSYNFGGSAYVKTSANIKYQIFIDDNIISEFEHNFTSPDTYESVWGGSGGAIYNTDISQYFDDGVTKNKPLFFNRSCLVRASVLSVSYGGSNSGSGSGYAGNCKAYSSASMTYIVY